MAHVDHGRRRTIPDQQVTDHVDGPLRRTQADSYWMPLAQRLEAFQAEGQVRASLVTCYGVNLIDDHRLDGAQCLSAAGAGQQQIQGLWGGYHQARTATEHLGSLSG